MAIYPNGDRFEGIWRRGQRHGRGRYWFANRATDCLSGVWIDDNFKSGVMISKSDLEPLEDFNLITDDDHLVEKVEK